MYGYILIVIGYANRYWWHMAFANASLGRFLKPSTGYHNPPIKAEDHNSTVNGDDAVVVYHHAVNCIVHQQGIVTPFMCMCILCKSSIYLAIFLSLYVHILIYAQVQTICWRNVSSTGGLWWHGIALFIILAYQSVESTGSSNH